jgi:hypothetical protein
VPTKDAQTRTEMRVEKLEHKLDHIQTLLSSINARMSSTHTSQVGGAYMAAVDTHRSAADAHASHAASSQSDSHSRERLSPPATRAKRNSESPAGVFSEGAAYHRLSRTSERGRGEGRDRSTESGMKTSLQGDAIPRIRSSRSPEGLESRVETLEPVAEMATGHQGGQLNDVIHVPQGLLSNTGAFRKQWNVLPLASLDDRESADVIHDHGRQEHQQKLPPHYPRLGHAFRGQTGVVLAFHEESGHHQMERAASSANGYSAASGDSNPDAHARHAVSSRNALYAHERLAPASTRARRSSESAVGASGARSNGDRTKLTRAFKHSDHYARHGKNPTEV